MNRSFVLTSLRRTLLPSTFAALIAATALPAHAAIKQAPVTTAPAATAAATPPDRSSSYYHFALSHYYEEQYAATGRSDFATQAIEEFKLALNNDQNSHDLQNGLAELYYHVNRPSEAVTAANELIQQDPNDLTAHVLLGRIYVRSLSNLQDNSNNGGRAQQLLQSAIAEYEKIVSLAPDNVEYHLLLGQLYASNHDSAKAEAQFKFAQKIEGSAEDVAMNLAYLYTQNGDMNHAIDVLKAVPAADRSARLEIELAGDYDQSHPPQMKPAIAAYNAALEIEPDNLNAARGLARDLFYDNQLTAAYDKYKDITTADPTDAEAWLRLAEIDQQRGQMDAAQADIAKAHNLVSDSLEIAFAEAGIDESLGKYDEAAEILTRLVAQLTSNRPSGTKVSDSDRNNLMLFMDKLASVQREQKKPDAAIATYRQVIALGGDSAERGYQGIVDTYHEEHDQSKATAAAQEAAKALPKDRNITLLLAGELANSGQVDAGVTLAKSLLKGTNADREVYTALSQIYSRLRRWQDASDALDQAEKLTTRPEEQAYIWFMRGALQDRQKHYDAAEAEFRKVLKQDPQSTMALNYLGYMLADRGTKLDEAVTLLKQAVAAEPQNGAYLDSLGWAYFRMGQYTLAEENLRKAVEKTDNDPTVIDHLADLYEKTGRLKEAEAAWTRAVAQFPQTNPADFEPGDPAKVQKKLENVRVKLAKQEGSHTASTH
jgi:tetratricopeptide (TPR) repeat protein